jgi:3-oxoacyl-[acyl-carrier-protein] synthase-1
MNSRRVACRLEEPGIVCALGSGAFQVHARMMAGDTSGLRAESGWLDGRSPALAAVHEALPAFPSHLPAHLNSRNNRLLLAAALQIESRLRDAIARLGAARVGIVLGTSTSGVNDNAAGFSALASAGAWPPGHDYRRQALNAPAEFLAAWLGITGPAYTLSTACTSSARALLSSRRLLELELCDAVVCGGADSLCRLTINGFSSLGAVSETRCQPFSVHRAGISIGEAAVVFLMQRGVDSGQVALLGGAGSSDAWHMSSPAPNGAGAKQAMLAALADARLPAADVGWVNLHGTGTVLNDAMESHAMHAIFSNGVACASTKGLTGHTLGAAGALEAALAWLTLDPTRNPCGSLPPHAWDGNPDPTLPLLDLCDGSQRYATGRARIAMSNSYAFGGNNVSLILGAHA